NARRSFGPPREETSRVARRSGPSFCSCGLSAIHLVDEMGRWRIAYDVSPDAGAATAAPFWQNKARSEISTIPTPRWRQFKLRRRSVAHLQERRGPVRLDKQLEQLVEFGFFDRVDRPAAERADRRSYRVGVSHHRGHGAGRQSTERGGDLLAVVVGVGGRWEADFFD